MLKIEFDAANKPLAAAIGAALTAYGADEAAPPKMSDLPGSVGVKQTTTVGDVSEVVEFTTPEAIAAAVDGTGNDAESATAPATTGTNEVSAPASAEVDENGVAKDPNFCGTAQKPFYGSGKRKGQWKKRQGVDDAAYDAWYAQRLAALTIGGAVTDNTTEEPAALDTAAAFGGQAATTEEPERTFKDGGEFMGWVSEMQTAGHLIEGDITDAYRACGVEIGHLFNPETAPDAIAAVYGKLSDVVARAQG